MKKFPSGSPRSLYAHPLPGAPLSTKPDRQSTEGYAQGSRLSADRCASHEQDGDAEQYAGLPKFRPPCGHNILRPALLCYCCLEQCITN
jgi:hypothetical protein